MAQRIVVDCDVHGARDESAEGTSYDVVVRKAGHSFVFVTVDLCNVCDKPLLDLLTELAEVGRVFDDSSAAELRAAVSQPRKRAASASAARVLSPDTAPKSAPRPTTPRPTTSKMGAPTKSTSCPATGCDYVGPTRGALRKHAAAAHKRTLSELDANPNSGTAAVSSAFSCPTCGSRFATPQRVGAHRAKAHGYRSGDDGEAAAATAAATAGSGEARGDE